MNTTMFRTLRREKFPTSIKPGLENMEELVKICPRLGLEIEIGFGSSSHSEESQSAHFTIHLLLIAFHVHGVTEFDATTE